MLAAKDDRVAVIIVCVSLIIACSEIFSNLKTRTDVKTGQQSSQTSTRLPFIGNNQKVFFPYVPADDS